MRNLTMLTDLYQLTMMYGYQKCGMRNNRAVFDMFYRNTGRRHAIRHHGRVGAAHRLHKKPALR